MYGQTHVELGSIKSTQLRIKAFNLINAVFAVKK